MTADEAAQFLAGSPERRRLLSSLRQSPASPRDVVDDLDVAHRTAQRHLSQLADRGWAAKQDGEYHLTTTGTLIADAHLEYLETLETIESLAEFYRRLPDPDCAPDPRWLRGEPAGGSDPEEKAAAETELVVATPDQPQAPVTYYIDAVSEFETDHVRMISPVLSRLFHDAHAQLVGGGVTHDLVMDLETVRRARELNPQEFDFIVGFDGLALFCRETPIEFGLTLGADRAIMHGYDGDGQLHALVDTTSQPFCEWAGSLFERYREASHEVDSPEALQELPLDSR